MLQRHLFASVLTALCAISSAVIDVDELADAISKLLDAGDEDAVQKCIDSRVEAALAENVRIDHPALKVNQQGNSMSYRILQVPDMHYTNYAYYICNSKPDSFKGACYEKYMTEMINKMLDNVKPDFVVFTGDQIESLIWPMSSGNSLKAIDTYSAAVQTRNIPWSMVFGNHDESYTPALLSNKKVMMAYIETLKGSYSKYGPMDIGGVGNYEISIEYPNNSSTALRMYFLDTGKDGTVSEGQKNYMKTLAASHTNDHAPAIMFFHIPIEEYKAFNGMGQGSRGDPVSAAKTNSHLFDTMVAMGDVKASFCGHDHYNDFCFYKSPLHLCYGGATGYGAAYGKGSYSRRVRVIDWNVSDGDESISTWQYFQETTNTMDRYSLFNKTR
uniref:Secreted protein n=1 Tax=Thraustotheca clavata TaxID=74557 RepID=A0A0A7CLL4_9STRA|nr:secreted protein [Thraustotheca clavata]